MRMFDKKLYKPNGTRAEGFRKRFLNRCMPQKKGGKN